MDTRGSAMTTHQMTRATVDDQAADRYRETERRLWDVYGLTATERFVELGEPALRLRVVEVGDGPPVLFIPGTGGTGPYWAPLVRELKGFRCLLLDRPGWGLSSSIEYDGDAYRSIAADILTRVLDALDIERAAVVGASIGDVWVLGLARAQPDCVERVVLLGGGPLRAELRPPMFLRLLATPLGAILVRIPERRRMISGQLAGLGHRASLEAGRFPDEFFDWRIGFSRETRSMRNERAMVRAVLRGGRLAPGLTFSDDELAQIQRPTLMLVGTEDPIGSAEMWHGLVAAMPDAKLEILDGAGHLPWWDDPTGTGSTARAFLAG